MFLGLKQHQQNNSGKGYWDRVWIVESVLKEVLSFSSKYNNSCEVLKYFHGEVLSILTEGFYTIPSESKFTFGTQRRAFTLYLPLLTLSLPIIPVWLRWPPSHHGHSSPSHWGLCQPLEFLFQLMICYGSIMPWYLMSFFLETCEIPSLTLFDRWGAQALPPSSESVLIHSSFSPVYFSAPLSTSISTFRLLWVLRPPPPPPKEKHLPNLMILPSARNVPGFDHLQSSTRQPSNLTVVLKFWCL